MVDRSPEVVHFAIDLHVDLVEEPPPLGVLAQRGNPLSPDLRGKYRAEPVPPQPHSLMANVDTAFEQ